MSLVEFLRDIRDSLKSQLKKAKHDIEIARIDIWVEELKYQEDVEQEQIIHANLIQALQDYRVSFGEDDIVIWAMSDRIEAQAIRRDLKRVHDNSIEFAKDRVNKRVARVGSLEREIAEKEKHIKAHEEANREYENHRDGKSSLENRPVKRRRCE